MSPTVDLEDHELRKVKGAMWELYDKHSGNGNTEVAEEYHDLYEKLHEVSES